MRVVTASIIGLCFMISPVWAVEVAPAPVIQENQTAQPQGTAATAQTQSTPKPAIIPAVATSAQPVPPAENKPLTAEEIAKLKAQQEAKVKALVKDQATRLQQLEKANLEALSQNQELQLKMTTWAFRYRCCKVNAVRRCSSTVQQHWLSVYCSAS